jgi:hypothetical protein
MSWLFILFFLVADDGGGWKRGVERRSWREGLVGWMDGWTLYII